MSLVTRCPACGTQFKVVRDQLRISDGWVRCGRCSEVFDASLDLRDTADETASVPGAALTTEEATVVSNEVATTPAAQDEVPSDLSYDAHDPPVSNDSHDSHDSHDSPIAGRPSLPESPDLDIDLLAPLSNRTGANLPGQVDALKWPAKDLLDWTPTVHAVATALEPAASTPPGGDLPPYGLIADEPWPVQPPAPFDAAQADAVADLAEAASRHAPIAALTPRVDPERIELTSPSFDTPAQEIAVDSQWQKALRRARAKADKISRSRDKKASLAVARAGGPAVVADAVSPEPAQPSGLSFLEDDVPARSGLRRPTVRARTWWWVAMLAALLLVVQVMRQERDVLAARQPGLRPVLSSLCSLTGCEIAALRQIGSITIDGAAFARDKEVNTYRLSFALRNSVPMPLAMPAVELTLLDTQERAVVRRVILPAEFGAPSVLAGNGERSASLTLTLNSTEAATLPPVAGYRVLAFYP